MVFRRDLNNRRLLPNRSSLAIEESGRMGLQNKDMLRCIVARVKDVINVGGVKVFPPEIEELLVSHPAAEEAMVYGAPEPRFGQAPRATVKLRGGAACPD